MVPTRLVHFSYLVASVYVLSHAFYRGWLVKISKKPEKNTLYNFRTSILMLGESLATKAIVDTLVWQGLASVIIPGLVVNRTCKLSRIVLNATFRKRLSNRVKKCAVTGIGIGMIPMIIRPIDR